MEALRGLGSTIPAFGGDGIASADWISEFSAPAAANAYLQQNHVQVLLIHLRR